MIPKMTATRYQRHYTDEQLASVDLKVHDPMAVENLSSAKPDPYLTPEILGEYDITPAGGRAANPDGPWVWCSHCQAARHWRGFVITNATNARHLIGSTCGPVHYGVTFAGARNAYTERARRKSLLHQVARYCASAAAMCEASEQLLKGEELKALDRKREELRKAAPDAFLRLATYASNDSELDEQLQVRDFAAEQRRDERVNSKSKGPAIFKELRRGIGRVQGKALLRTADDVREWLLRTKNAVLAIERLRDLGTDELKTKQLADAVRSVDRAIETASARIEECRHAHEFFSEANLLRLERWSASHSGFRLSADGDKLRVADRRAGRSEVEPLRPLLLASIPVA